MHERAVRTKSAARHANAVYRHPSERSCRHPSRAAVRRGQLRGEDRAARRRGSGGGTGAVSRGARAGRVGEQAE